MKFSIVLKRLIQGHPFCSSHLADHGEYLVGGGLHGDEDNPAPGLLTLLIMVNIS